MKSFVVLIAMPILAVITIANHADAEPFGRAARVTPRSTGGLGSQTPEALSSDLESMRYTLEGLDSQINELSNPKFLAEKRIHPEKAREFLTSAQRSRQALLVQIQEVSVRLATSQSFVATNEAREAKGEINENNARIAEMLNQVDSRFGAFLLPTRTHTQIYFAIGQNHPDMKEFELKISELLAQGEHRVVLKLFNALNDTVYARVRDTFNPGRRYNNTLTKTTDVLLDTLFVKDLPPSEELQKLRADVIASALETASQHSVVEYRGGDSQRTTISNMISHIYSAKLKMLNLDPTRQPGTDRTARQQAVSTLQLAVASTAPDYLRAYSSTKATQHNATYAEGGFVVASLVTVNTQAALLDYTVAVLMAGNGFHASLVPDLQLIVDNFPNYPRRNQLKELIATLQTPSQKYVDVLAKGLNFKKSLLGSMAISSGARTCESLFR